jgi:hypothetical protein
MGMGRPLILFVIIAAVGVFYLSTMRVGHTWVDDFSMYIHHAKNLVEGLPYDETGYIFNDDKPFFGPQTYPPVFPILLAPVYAHYGLDLQAMKAELIIIFLFFLLALYLAFKNEAGFSSVAAIVALIGLNPEFWDFKDKILSELPFMLFLYLSFFIIERAHGKIRPSGYTELFLAIVAGLFMYLAYGTRSVGIVLVPSLIVFDLLRHRKPTRFTLLATLVFLALMTLQNAYVHSDMTYLVPALQNLSLDDVIRDLRQYPGSLARFFYHGSTKATTAIFIIILTISAVGGYWKRVREGMTVLEIFPIFYVAILLVYPYYGGSRFLMPIVPIYLLYVFVGTARSRVLGERLLIKPYFVILVAVIATHYAGEYSRSDFRAEKEGVEIAETRALFEFVSKNTRPDDVMVFRKPRVLTLYTGRPAAVYHEPDDDMGLWSFFSRISADYLITAKPLDDEFFPLFVARYAGHLESVYRNAAFEVFRIKDIPRESAPIEPGAKKKKRTKLVN